MSWPSWITLVRFVPRPAFSRPQCATDFASREKFGARSAVDLSSMKVCKRCPPRLATGRRGLPAAHLRSQPCPPGGASWGKPWTNRTIQKGRIDDFL